MADVGIAFDLEGTCVDLEASRHGAHIAAAASLGIVIDLDFALAKLPHFIGGPDEKVAADIYDLRDSSFHMPRDQFVEEFLTQDSAIFAKEFAEAAISPREGVVEFLDWLREKDIPFTSGR